MNKYFVLVLVLLCGIADCQRPSRQRRPPSPGFENLFFPNGRPPPPGSVFPGNNFNPGGFPGAFPGSFPGGNGGRDRNPGGQGRRDREDEWMREPERDREDQDNFVRPARDNEWALPNGNNWSGNGGSNNNNRPSNGGNNNFPSNGGGNNRPNNGGNNNWPSNGGVNNFPSNGGGNNNRPNNGGNNNWPSNGGGNNRPNNGDNNNWPNNGNNNRPSGGNDNWGNNNNNNNNNWNNDRTTTTTFRPTLMGPLAVVHNPPADCNCQVGPQYNPVCGSDGQNYRNRELLECVARCGTRVTVRRRGTC